MLRNNAAPSRGGAGCPPRRFSCKMSRMKHSRLPPSSEERTPRVRRAPTILAVQHAVQLLRSLSAEGPGGVSEIASRLGLHKSTVSRLVATLEADDLVERDSASRRIRVGPGLLSVASPLLVRGAIAEVVRAPLVELAQRCGETISLSIWDGAGAVNLEQMLGGKAIKHYAPPGSRNPAHCTAAGKLLLAHAPVGVIDRVLARELPRYTPRTLATAAAVRTEIALIRRRGYALNLGEFAVDVGGVAVALTGSDGEVAGAITATVPMYRFSTGQRTRLLAQLASAADAASARLTRRDQDRSPA